MGDVTPGAALRLALEGREHLVRRFVLSGLERGR
jgi:hypothetical protein